MSVTTPEDHLRRYLLSQKIITVRDLTSFWDISRALTLSSIGFYFNTLAKEMV